MRFQSDNFYNDGKFAKKNLFNTHAYTDHEKNSELRKLNEKYEFRNFIGNIPLKRKKKLIK